MTDLKVDAAFASGHPFHPCAPGNFLPADAAELLRAADVVLAMEWIDLGGTLATAVDAERPSSAIAVSCTLDDALLDGWTKDSFGRAPSTCSYVATRPPRRRPARPAPRPRSE